MESETKRDHILTHSPKKSTPFFLERQYMSEHEKTRAKLGTGEIEGNAIVIREKSHTIAYKQYFITNSENTMLIERIARSKHYSDAFIFNVMACSLDPVSGLCLMRQVDIVQKTGIMKSKVSESIARLSKPVEPPSNSTKNADGSWPATLPELVRKYEKNGLRGFALNPEVVVIGNHRRAEKLWLEAEQQAIEKAEKAAKAAINAAAESSTAEWIDNIIAEQDIDFL